MRSTRPSGSIAERVLAIPELRQHILLLLPQKSVAVMMRVSKAVFPGAVLVLYKRIGHAVAVKMSNKTVRILKHCP